MSKDWCEDINNMHKHFGFHEAVEKLDNDKLNEYLKFRINFLQEELNELKSAESGEDVVDALIDLCVVAIGTLDLYDVNSHEAWNKVHAANMSKKAGVKPNRPNPLGLPDLMKPEGWVGPSHEGNHGLFAKLNYPVNMS